MVDVTRDSSGRIYKAVYNSVRLTCNNNNKSNNSLGGTDCCVFDKFKQKELMVEEDWRGRLMVVVVFKDDDNLRDLGLSTFIL